MYPEMFGSGGESGEVDDSKSKLETLSVSLSVDLMRFEETSLIL